MAQSILKDVEFPHRLFSLCLKITKGKTDVRSFITKDKRHYISIFGFPESNSISVSISGKRDTDSVEEDIRLRYYDGLCEYSVQSDHTSLVARSISYLVNREKYIETPPFRDWFRWILDGAYNALENSTRINPYTKKELPYFEDTEDDKYLRAMLGEVDRVSKEFGQTLREANYLPGIYTFPPLDPEEIEKRMREDE